MSIDGKFKKGDFVLVKAGVESVEKGSIKFRGNVIAFIKEIEGDYARVNVAFESQDLTLTYKLADLKEY